MTAKVGDWQQLLRETKDNEIVESGTLGSVEWKHYDNGLLTFFGSGPIADFMYELTYPDYHDDYHTEYHPYWSTWFGKDVQVPVKYVYIDGGITQIDNRAFENCHMLEISIPNSVTEIGYRALAGNSFKFLKLSDNLKKLGTDCLRECDCLKTFVIPASVENLGKIGGKYRSALDSIQVERGNTHYKVVDDVLYTNDMTELLWCPKTKAGVFQVPSTVKRIDDYAFDDCSDITELIFSDTPVSLGNGCLSDTRLNKLVLPKEVEIEFSLFTCGHHEHPVTHFVVPCGTENLIVYLDNDSVARDYFKKHHIQIFGEPVDYNTSEIPAEYKKKSVFSKLFSKIFCI